MEEEFHARRGVDRILRATRARIQSLRRFRNGRGDGKHARPLAAQVPRAVRMGVSAQRGAADGVGGLSAGAFDGFTPATDFATWYWTPDTKSNASGTRLVDLEARGEEFLAALYQGGISMPTLPTYVIGIQRVENDDRRVMYDLQLRHVKNKVDKRQTSTPWTHTMEGWGFHAPVCSHADGEVVAMFTCPVVQREREG